LNQTTKFKKENWNSRLKLLWKCTDLRWIACSFWIQIIKTKEAFVVKWWWNA